MVFGSSYLAGSDCPRLVAIGSAKESKQWLFGVDDSDSTLAQQDEVGKVEDTQVFPTVGVLDRSNNCRETGAMPSANRDEADTKLVGAYAAYARGLTPMHVRAVLL